ncbi:hypothetical protein SRRS_42580 [Sporomusa rhizae]
MLKKLFIELPTDTYKILSLFKTAEILPPGASLLVFTTDTRESPFYQLLLLPETPDW